MTAERDIAIQVKNLSKMYKVYSRPSDMFWEMLTAKPRYKPFWALMDISFEVPRGSVVGVMGRNGAGKSTLLKILSGTLDKTSGEVTVQGKISSILELGTGFNPEYTGRQNIYLGGLMVGMTREEINQKMDWIIEFSELEQVIDQAFKTYSTGMQARLTFSTAVCIEPDIIIVDEALSVGDAKFARKSYGKIHEFREAGHTILMVSHDINTISTFCDHALLLENGKVYEQGKPYEIGQIYYQLLFGNPEKKELSAGEGSKIPVSETFEGNSIAAPGTKSDHMPEETGEQIEDLANLDRPRIKEIALKKLNLLQPFDQGNSHQRRIGNNTAEILDYGILDNHGNKVNLLISGEQYRLYSRVVFYETVKGATWGFVIRNIKGVDMFGTSSLVQKLPTIAAQRGALIESVCDVNMWLTNGIYFLSVAVADPYAVDNVQYDLIYDAFQFEVRIKEGIFTTSVVNLNPQPIERNVLFGDANFKPLEPHILATIH
jgi:ABC-type polysaccharide/polyol phosphate transport system ATPase subunit